MSKAQVPYDQTRYISWNQFYKLSWENFKAPNQVGRFGDAGTAVKIIAKPYIVKRRVEYNVYALFDKQNSWASDFSDNLLRHEQLHFDIAELFARKVRKKIKALQAAKVKEVATYNKAINKILTESNAYDKRYDKVTLHGSLKEQQVFWEKKVMMELAELGEFSQ